MSSICRSSAALPAEIRPTGKSSELTHTTVNEGGGRDGAGKLWFMLDVCMEIQRAGREDTDKHTRTDGDLDRELENEWRKLTDVQADKLWQWGGEGVRHSPGALVASSDQKTPH